MLPKIFVIFISLPVFYVVIVAAQIICTKQTKYLKTQERSITYLDYNGNLQRKTIQDSEWATKTTKTCCEGYRKYLEISEDLFMCEPTCEPRCPGTQYCVNPGACSCMPGYKINPHSTSPDDLCIPECSACEDSYCKLPEVCSCHADNKLLNENCTSQCGTLRFDLSIEFPSKCLCQDFLQSNGLYSCQKYFCYRDCGNGYCTDDHECLCHPGWHVVRPEDNFSGLLCAPTCENCEGDCVAPNKCIKNNSATSYEHKVREHTIPDIFSTAAPLEIKSKLLTVSNFTSREDEEKSSSWFKRSGITVLLSVIFVLSVVILIIVLVLWQRTSIMVYFRARYYVPDDHLPADRNNTNQVTYTKKHADEFDTKL